MIESLPDGLVEGLLHPSAYPFDSTAVAEVTSVQTHISHVFLTRSSVYKVRKAVDLGFLDFSTRQLRNDDCLREVALNRRLARDVYRGVASVVVDGRGARVGAVADAVDPAHEHCVVMRRLPHGRDALSLLGHGRFGEAHVDAIADAILQFHLQHRLGQPAPFTPGDWLQRISGAVEDNFIPMGGVLDQDRISTLAEAARQFLGEREHEFERRRVEGRAVDGHGDLHLAHVWFETDDGKPIFIDCLEFSERLRHIDGASEAAFLTMDLSYRGRPDLGERFLRRYAAGTDDFHLYTVVDYYLSYRAAVRAKVAAIAAAEIEVPAEQRRAAKDSATRHLELAMDALRARTPGPVVMMTGIVGTGKSVAASVVATALGAAAVIASDRVRKQLAGLGARDRSGDALDGGIYSPTSTRRVYDAVLARAKCVIGSGRTAILDATFSTPDQRSLVTRLARALTIPLLVVETRCAADRVLMRLGEREREGRDPSDAGPDFYAESAARFAPVHVEGGASHLVIDTDSTAWQDELSARVVAWRRQLETPRSQRRS